MDRALIALGAGAYLLGAIPFSVIIARLKGIDLRKVGSGNLGATNVFRNLGAKWGVMVFCLDAFKAGLPTAVAIYLVPNQYAAHICVGLIAVLGHSFSVFAKFKGGKGVACAAGVLAVIAPHVFMVVFCVVIALIASTRIVSVGSIGGAILMPLLLWVWQYPTPYLIVMSLLSIFVIIKHRTNIQRLLKGTENKI
ncbi:MAG: glycerol-3-phosphate 1-O-acyltransferase PlsY [bacterium]|nr:glycerol-3-phosphate 1-O-acyltransferase PlsY [bacterium]